MNEYMRLDDRTQIATLTSEALRLLQLDDLWTTAVREWSSSPNNPQSSPEELFRLANEMKVLLETIGNRRDFLSGIGDSISDEDEDLLNSVLWGNELSAEDQADLRWIITREGGLRRLIASAVDTLSNYYSEIEHIDQQMQALGLGEAVNGDLTRKFRCALGLTLIGGGFLSLPPTIGGAVGVGLTVGAVGAGLLVGATGGVAGLAIIAAGIFFIRKSKC